MVEKRNQAWRPTLQSNLDTPSSTAVGAAHFFDFQGQKGLFTLFQEQRRSWEFSGRDRVWRPFHYQASGGATAAATP